MASQAPLDAVISHWSTLIEDFQASPLGFYIAVEAALVRRAIPITKNERIDYREAGMLSANREYLHIRREKLAFDICAAPFGTGFFVSWWLAEDRKALHPALRAAIGFAMFLAFVWFSVNVGLTGGLVVLTLTLIGAPVLLDGLVTQNSLDEGIARSIPVLGTLYAWMFKPESYYRIDSMEMFEKAVHNAVLEVIDAMTAEKGIRALAEGQRKPVMREFYKK
jgi:hypothetical protein